MISFKMRLIPSIIDKLLYHIAPADTIVAGNACAIVFGPLTCRQLHYRVAQPKKGMLLLAWPLCMHDAEDAGNFFTEIKFYSILRKNARSADPDIDVDKETLKFLYGFETFMLQCVLSNISLYDDLKVLMLDFHTASPDYKRCGKDKRIAKTKPADIPSEWFLCEPTKNNLLPTIEENEFSSVTTKRLSMHSELWGCVIYAIVAQCASKLQHFVFTHSFWLPEQFYLSFKFDCMLAQMQNLETLYLPSIEDYEVAHCEKLLLSSPQLKRQRSCWKALHEAISAGKPVMPKVRRIVVDTVDGLTAMYAAGIIPFLKLRESIANASSSSLALPTQHYFVEVLEEKSYNKKSWIQKLVAPSSNIHVEYRYRKQMNLVLNVSDQTWNCEIGGSCANCNTLYNDDLIRQFEADQDVNRFSIDAAHLLANVVENRQNMMSVLNSIRDNSFNSIPANVCSLEYCKNGENINIMLAKLSSTHLHQPLSLTAVMGTREFSKSLPLFVCANSSTGKSALPLWSKYFSRKTLKLSLNGSGLNSAFSYMTDDEVKELQKTRKFCKRASLIVPENRYSFPPNVTIFTGGSMFFSDNEHGASNAITYDLQEFREIFRSDMQAFVDNVTDKGMSPAAEASDAVDGALTKALRTDLYASCRKVELSLYFQYNTNSGPIGVEEKLKRQLLAEFIYSREFESELVQEIFSDIICPVEMEQPSSSLLMPRLTSIVMQPVLEFVDN